jgi:putrescine transport system substrate-binding protein
MQGSVAMPLSAREVRLGIAGLLAAALLAGCGEEQAPATPAAAAPAGSGVVNVYNWSDYIAEDTVPTFQNRTGLRVNYNVYSGNEVLIERLTATPDAYDVIFPSARPFAEELVAGKALLALDKSKLPNLRNLDPAILAELADIDPGNAHLVPYMWGTTGLGLNVAQVREALGPDAALDTWGLVFDPANAAKLSRCGIGVIDDNLETSSALRLWQGRSASDHSAEADEATRRALLAIRPHVRKVTGSSELIRDLADGDLCLVLSFSGDVLQARAQAAEAAETAGTAAPEIRYVIPREGAVRWVDVIAIPAKARNPAAAHRFIDYLLEPKVIAGISNYVSYANANAASTSSLDPEISGDPGIYPPDSVRAKLQQMEPATTEDAERRKQTWNAFVFGEM